MCGIFGHIKTRQFDYESSSAALNTLAHRGPDQSGHWLDDKVFLGHRRLSILDISDSGRQPMSDPAESVVITVNGEIYNYKPLKQQLQSKYQFKSTSDSEVVLYGFMEWGIDGLLERIDGMYAICIYDKRHQSVYLVRDRVGIKPVIYGNVNGEFAWASELKALRQYYASYCQLEKDPTALYDFLTYKYIPTPKTLYKNIFNLPPASYLKFDVQNRTFSTHRYWQLDATTRGIGLDEAMEETLRLIDESVSEQLMSDVPLGFFLSGGLDSSTLVSSAAQSAESVNTYTLGFSSPTHDETERAGVIAQHLGTSHHTTRVEYEESKALFSELGKWFDQPFGDISALPSYRISEYIKSDCQVAISGDGGDELFGGYKRYRKYQHRQKSTSKPKVVADHALSSLYRISRHPKVYTGASEIKRRYLLSGLELYAKLANGLVRSEKKGYTELLEIPQDYDDYWYFRSYFRPELGLRKSLQYMDFHTYLPDQVLTKMDRVSMQVSLEARVPFLSRKLIEFSFGLPEDICYADGALKGLLKRAVSPRLPQSILTLPKKGFGAPVNEWEGVFKTEGSLQETLLKPYLT